MEVLWPDLQLAGSGKREGRHPHKKGDFQAHFTELTIYREFISCLPAIKVPVKGRLKIAVIGVSEGGAVRVALYHN